MKKTTPIKSVGIMPYNAQKSSLQDTKLYLRTVETILKDVSSKLLPSSMMYMCCCCC